MRVQENPFLEEWEKVCDTQIVGSVGHSLKYEGGPAHPMGYAPIWVTANGVDLRLLHTAYSATMCHDHNGEVDNVLVKVEKQKKRKFWLVARRVVA